MITYGDAEDAPHDKEEDKVDGPAGKSSELPLGEYEPQHVYSNRNLDQGHHSNGDINKPMNLHDDEN